jgi:hypothetical protein
VSVLHHPPPGSHRVAHGYEAHVKSWRIVVADSPSPICVKAETVNPADALDSRRLAAVLGVCRDLYSDAATLRELVPWRMMPNVVLSSMLVEVLVPQPQRAETFSRLVAALGAEPDTVPEPEPVPPRRRSRSRFGRLFARAKAAL